MLKAIKLVINGVKGVDLMRILTSQQMKNAEESAFENFCSPSELMMRAGEKCAEILVKKFGDDLKGKRIAVFCGNGKNAGDGFVISKKLHDYGYDTEIVFADKMPTLDDPLKYYNDAIESGIKTYKASEYDYSSDLIIDCIFGIGFHGEVNEPFKSVINNINLSRTFKVSIDLPSGVNATTGEVSVAVRADLTIAVSDYKLCHVLPPANSFCGEIAIARIGIPDECYDKCEIDTITKKYVKKLFNKRDKNCNKGDNGRLLNICGSYLMPGAAVISAKAALRTGVGLLECAFPKSIYGTITAHLIQPVFTPLCENEQKTVSIGALSAISERIRKADAILIGCGLGNNDDTQVVVSEVIKSAEVPLVIDADGLNSININLDVLKGKKSDVIVTPHPGEMARLIDKDVQYVQSHRIECAKQFAGEYGVVVVLKGANTIVTDGEKIKVNIKGNPGMAMGGTGDMLAGMIASFAAQKLGAFDAAVAGVYIHSLCGDITADDISERGMVIEDMLEITGEIMSEFE